MKKKITINLIENVETSELISFSYHEKVSLFRMAVEQYF